MTAPGVSSDYAAKREVMADFALAFTRVLADSVPDAWKPEVQLAEPPESDGLGVVVWFKAFDQPSMHVTTKRRILDLMRAARTLTDLVPSIPMQLQWLRPGVNGPFWGFVLRVTDLGDVPAYPKFITVSNVELRATNLLRRKLGIPEKEGSL